MSAEVPPQPSNRIAELRQARGWSMTQLGGRCRPPVDGSQINKIEKGATGLSPKWIRTLAAALGCNPLEVLPDDLRVAVMSFRDALAAAADGAPVMPDDPGVGRCDQPTLEEWEIIRQYRQAGEPARAFVRTALAPPEGPPAPAPAAAGAAAPMFEFKAEHDGTYRFKTFWPPETTARPLP